MALPPPICSLSRQTRIHTCQENRSSSPSLPSKEVAQIISIENGTRVLSTTEHVCNDGQTTVKLAVTSDMQPNAYIYITLLQPHGVTKNDLPIRMYGVVPFTVTSPESHLAPIIHMADEVKPEAPCHVMVSEKNGREMAYTLAIVDEGLLDLTRFRTPDPWQAFTPARHWGLIPGICTTTWSARMAAASSNCSVLAATMP